MAAVVFMIAGLLLIAFGIIAFIYDNIPTGGLGIILGIICLSVFMMGIKNYQEKVPETEIQGTEMQNTETQGTEINIKALKSKLEKLYPDAHLIETDGEYYAINGEEVYLIKVIDNGDTDTDCSLMLKPCDDMIFVE